MRRIEVALLALLAVASAPLVAGEVYSWRDANGVTHYSQTPPPSGTRFEVRDLTGRTAVPTPTAAAATPAATTAAPATGAQEPNHCELARANIAALEGQGPVQQVGADGTARELDAAARTSQLELARAAARAYCR
ncbi:DUF4124 domain-containing protein [Luteimonas deserti]|uniref:DUF4124 domain-containing protein n=1 Tax=Luteimonas deserti TaxID=2752306 RepID=A0A7Z0TYE8_9GAMM|nr:DUF4124 domain-containing protein [Luteimonas deserti]NYZ62287.1 DUF4124 domain-containing protein [Luteimonas deserti]